MGKKQKQIAMDEEQKNPYLEHFGTHPKTTFWEDFTKAEGLDIDSISDVFMLLYPDICKDVGSVCELGFVLSQKARYWYDLSRDYLYKMQEYAHLQTTCPEHERENIAREEHAQRCVYICNNKSAKYERCLHTLEAWALDNLQGENLTKYNLHTN